jgi:hypothetical protein
VKAIKSSVGWLEEKLGKIGGKLLGGLCYWIIELEILRRKKVSYFENGLEFCGLTRAERYGLAEELNVFLNYN